MKVKIITAKLVCPYHSHTTNNKSTPQFIMFAMTSGQMWLHIRGAPFAHVDRNTGNEPLTTFNNFNNLEEADCT